MASNIHLQVFLPFPIAPSPGVPPSDPAVPRQLWLLHLLTPLPPAHSQVFLPLTRLCRDSCGYCTFAQPPRPGARAYMTLDEVLAVAELGARQGCTEALLTLGKGGEGLVRGRAAQRQALTLLAWGNCD